MEQSLDREARTALRPVRPEDEEFLLDVYASTRADEMALVNWSESQKRDFLRMQFNAQRSEYTARFPVEAEYSVILFEGRPAGRFWVARTAEEIRLLDIALLPEFQNRGIGTLLLRRLMDEAARKGVPLRHMVFKFNTAASRFYERLGFKLFEEAGAYDHMEWRPEGDAAAANR